MALNWNVEKVDESAKTEQEWPVTEALIWLTMSVGINQITEANAEEFAVRVAMIEKVYGPHLYRYDGQGDREPLPITLVDVRRRIGLGTNASPLTKAAFRNKVIAEIRRQAEQEVGRQARKV